MRKCGQDWTGSGLMQWRALVNTIMNVWFPKKAGNFLAIWAITGFGRTLPFWSKSVNNLELGQTVSDFEEYKNNNFLNCILSLSFNHSRMADGVNLAHALQLHLTVWTCSYFSPIISSSNDKYLLLVSQHKLKNPENIMQTIILLAVNYSIALRNLETFKLKPS